MTDAVESPVIDGQLWPRLPPWGSYIAVVRIFLAPDAFWGSEITWPALGTSKPPRSETSEFARHPTDLPGMHGVSPFIPSEFHS